MPEFISTLMQENANDHDDYCHEKYENGNPVHAVHQPGVHIPGIILIALTDIQISKQLSPHKKTEEPVL